ncbi:hypothetical protein [Halorussus marinus]|uniref:hypothetical protein n=1 Tax=Halorussus marinus TaxID=2505976 RepID=UPI001093235A|nr:hypothetical protein [Halorussus marinus]
MSSTTRRSVLAALSSAAVVATAGCSSIRSDDPPAGSLRFVNDDDVPHTITMGVTGVGDEPGDGAGMVDGDPVVPPAQRNLTAGTSIEPGESSTYESVFTEPVWYAVRFTVDGREPENQTGVTAFRPSPTDSAAGNTLAGKIYESGEFSWIVSSTDDAGSFGE